MINFLLKISAFIGIVLLSPIIFISMALIVIEDGLPFFFIQERLGKNQKIFKIYKIRTMFNSTPNLGTHEVSVSNYLKIGSFLRSLKIDELPQIINYIKGDLNLIGPRPGLPSQNDLKIARIKNNIFDITPGITGLSQVLGYDMSNPNLLSEIDAIYLKKKSLKIDILIFLATFYKPLRKRLVAIFKTDIEEGLQNV
tara:strand:+ start:2963 stop:3553 length:591 start_codon:yes stop_codon:yes gene_type:complete